MDALGNLSLQTEELVYIEPMVGWRAWKVQVHLDSEKPGIVLLNSPQHSNFVWPPYADAHAQCGRSVAYDGYGRSEEYPGEEIPHSNCGCGFYAADSYSNLIKLSHPSYNIENGYCSVIGECNLYGNVVKAEKGWRAQIAYPKRLWVPFEVWQLVKPLRNTYGVPVSLKNWLKDKAENF